MNTLIFAQKDIGELHISCAEVQLPEGLSYNKETQEKVRFNFKGLDYISSNEFTLDYWKKTPLFFEWQAIDVFFEPAYPSKFYPPFRVLINGRDSGLISRQIRGRPKMSGTIRIAQAVGFSEFQLVDARNKQLFALEMEVFPQKLNYKEDFHDMISEITDIIYNLAFDYLKKTYAFAIPRPSHSPTISEWLAILHTLFKSLVCSIDQILQNPSSKINRENRIKQAEKVKKSSRHTIKWIQKNPKYTKRGESGGVRISANTLITHLPEQHRRLSYDTYANRFVKWAIGQIIQQIDNFISQLRQQLGGQSKIDKELELLSNYKARLQNRVKDPVFSGVCTFDEQREFSTVLNMAPAYRDFYHKFLLLQKGLYLYDHDVFRLDYKDIATLYEYWCFLKLVKSLYENANFDLKNQDLIRIEHKKLSLRLQKGQASEVTLDNKRGDQIKIFYNKRLESDTFIQIPDNLIAFYKAGYQRPFRIVMDAKYRFDRGSKNYPNSKIPNGPPLDTIAQLHRYRDAILFSDKQTLPTSRIADKAFGGIILFPFPGKEDDFRNHPFYQSIHEANIGALPLLPGKNKPNTLFQTYLKEMFEASPEVLYEQYIEYDKSEYHFLLQQLSNIVLIGAIPRDHPENWETYFISKIVYLAYTEEMANKLEKIKILALYDLKSQNIIGYGFIKSIAFVLGEELIQSETIKHISPEEGKKKYIKFTLEYFEPCTLSIKMLFHEGVTFTNEFALLKAIEYQNQAYLEITTYEDVKIWRQLSRIDDELVVKYEKIDSMNRKQNIFYFKFHSSTIFCYKIKEDYWRFLGVEKGRWEDYDGRQKVHEFLSKNIQKLTS